MYMAIFSNVCNSIQEKVPKVGMEMIVRLWEASWENVANVLTIC